MGSWSSSCGPTPTPSRESGNETARGPHLLRRRGSFGRGPPPERGHHQGARFSGIDAVGLQARRGVFEHALWITPQPVLLELILELDAERACEHREVVLDRDSAVGLEAADHPLAAVIDAGH